MEKISKPEIREKMKNDIVDSIKANNKKRFKNILLEKIEAYTLDELKAAGFNPNYS